VNFAEVKRVYLELSNCCNLAHCHKKCPASLPKEPVFLPRKVAESALDQLGEQGYRGSVYFFVFNEPTIDPRLFVLAEYARKRLPVSKLHVLTNGLFFNQALMNEMFEVGINVVEVSCYSQAQYERLQGLWSKGGRCYIRWVREFRQDMIGIYGAEPCGVTDPCYFWTALVVSHTGMLRVCCSDYRDTIAFGDLRTESLKELVESSKFRKLRAELSEGVRNEHVCQRCSARTKTDGGCQVYGHTPRTVEIEERFYKHDLHGINI